MWNTLNIELARSGAVVVTAGDTRASFRQLDDAIAYMRERLERERTVQEISRTIE